MDRTSIEIFGNEGEVHMPMGIIPSADNQSTRVLAEGGPVKLESLEIHLAVTIARSPTRYQSSVRPSKPIKAQKKSGWRGSNPRN